MTSCGELLPSRAENQTSSLLSPASTKLKVPFPATSEVTLYSTQVFISMDPLLSTAFPMRAGRLFQVIPVSVQLLPRSEEHTSELQSQSNLVCRLLLEKKKK